MGLWDMFCDEVLCPLGSVISDAVEGTGSVIDKAVNVVVIDGVCGGIDKVVETVTEHPVETAIVAAAAVATGGVALAAAGPIAASAGAAGLLGSASTGTAISSLGGAALTNASLAALGGGAISAGGAGMAGGTTVIAAAGVITGGAVSGSAVAMSHTSE